MTGRLGDSRLGEHRLGGETRLGRATSAAAQPATASTGRESASAIRATTSTSSEIAASIDRSISLARVPTATLSAATASTSRDSASFTRLTASYAAPITTEIDGGPLDWRIGGQMLKESWIDELTPHTLTITFHTDRDGLEYWRQYDRAGDVQVEVGFGGTFQAVDRGGRDDALELQPPFRQTPPFDEAEFYVTNYSEAQLSSELFEIEFEFQRSEPRSGVFDVVDRSGEPWVFDFDRGTIALEERRVSRIDRDGGPTGGDTSIEVLLTDLEAAALADVAGVPDAVVDREVPDGPGFAEDTSGGRHTVAITSPDGAPLEGDWVIRNWSLAMHNRSDERWLVELQLAEG
ncbi:hypothetical protein [Natronolimnobius baerhuensis]|uniref:Uncharacterized protein n=1 Tax=Natronolimnobius baerhuensis TaxID=253108 RepID=A0A202E4R7_9EURY|nr:hypothetical protein [Natronolimnobius baerhuensis]OVE83188.1 hypothetical protein B2G88_17420 [Natronolimnobius baerhuensis]